MKLPDKLYDVLKWVALIALNAIGVCYIGGMDEQGRYADTRTPAQKAALHYLLEELKDTYPQAKIVGHRDFPNVAKSCPCFDAQSEYARI